MHLHNRLLLLFFTVPSYGLVLHINPVHTRHLTPSLGVRKRYLSEDSEFDIKVGPDHHLIEVDHKKLDQLGDHLVEVHEVNVDAMNVTAVLFITLALTLFVLANTDSVFSGSIASLQNTFT